MTQNEAAVIAAAKRWLSAKELILAQDEGADSSIPDEQTLDQAEYDLTEAVCTLLGRGPRVPS